MRHEFPKTLKPALFFFLGAASGGAVLFLSLLLSLFLIKREYSQKVYPNIFVFSTNISGMTEEQVKDFLLLKKRQIKEKKFILLWDNGETKKTWEIFSAMIDFNFDESQVVKEAFCCPSLLKLLVFPREIFPQYGYSEEKLNSLIAQIAKETNRPAKDALFEFKEGKVSEFQTSQEGFLLDEKQAKFLIVSSFNSLPGRMDVSILDLPVRTLFPKITTEESNRLGIKEFLGEGESFFKDSIPSRVHNIILASSKLHGIVIPQGEIFSFAEKIGDISEESGYQKAYVIKEKKTILEDGGGVCQVSTTLFRTALNTGLPIVERQAHYYRVGFYEQGGYPPGLDATVYPPSPDLKFKNDTPAAILIQTEINKSKKRLAFKIYGTRDGRKFNLTKPIIHSQTAPPEPLYVDEPSLPVGTVKRMDVAHWGAKVSFQRTVWNADGSVKEEKTFWSNYTPWPAVYQRGVGQ